MRLAWKEEGANRREVDLDTYNDRYLVPAFGLMRKLEVDDHTYWTEFCWTEFCLKLTQRSVEVRED